MPCWSETVPASRSRTYNDMVSISIYQHTTCTVAAGETVKQLSCQDSVKHRPQLYKVKYENEYIVRNKMQSSNNYTDASSGAARGPMAWVKLLV